MHRSQARETKSTTSRRVSQWCLLLFFPPASMRWFSLSCVLRLRAKFVLLPTNFDILNNAIAHTYPATQDTRRVRRTNRGEEGGGGDFFTLVYCCDYKPNFASFTFALPTHSLEHTCSIVLRARFCTGSFSLSYDYRYALLWRVA